MRNNGVGRLHRRGVGTATEKSVKKGVMGAPHTAEIHHTGGIQDTNPHTNADRNMSHPSDTTPHMYALLRMDAVSKIDATRHTIVLPANIEEIRHITAQGTTNNTIADPGDDAGTVISLDTTRTNVGAKEDRVNRGNTIPKVIWSNIAHNTNRGNTTHNINRGNTTLKINKGNITHNTNRDSTTYGTNKVSTTPIDLSRHHGFRNMGPIDTSQTFRARR